MKLNKLPKGERIFIDANIFIYHFTGASSECKDFLKACSEGAYQAFSSTTVLAEVCHRLMLIEAFIQKETHPKNPALHLHKHPDTVKNLTRYYTQLTYLLNWNIEILPFTEDILIKSQAYREYYGLLTNDSFIPIFMEQANTLNIATADQSFTSISNMNLYRPLDLKK